MWISDHRFIAAVAALLILTSVFLQVYSLSAIILSIWLLGLGLILYIKHKNMELELMISKKRRDLEQKFENKEITAKQFKTGIEKLADYYEAALYDNSRYFRGFPKRKKYLTPD